MLLVLVATCFSFCSAAVWSVTQGSSGLVVARGRSASALATAVEADTRAQNGWVQLDVQTPVQDAAHLYAAGYLEGAVHQHLIYAAFFNFANATTAVGGVAPAPTVAFMNSQLAWVRTQVKRYSNNSAYWRSVELILVHFDGIIAGYMATAPTTEYLSATDLLVYVLQDELPDYVLATNTSAVFHATLPGRRARLFGSHCSVLVKLTPHELWTAHDTWYDYNSMLRVMKTYRFGPTSVASFASYPGLPMSGDDYIITANQLAIVETTLNVYNESLYGPATFPLQAVPYWIRVQVANGATSAPEWHALFAAHNNGGYNNQWIVVDYKLYTPGAPLEPNTLVVGEQMPGYYVSDDLTAHLQNTTYWGSYNIAFFPVIDAVSGQKAMRAAHGDAFSWTRCPRARVYARDHGSVSNLAGMKRIQRYNEWQTDPLALQSASGQISSRADLNAPSTGHVYAPFGGIDCKITGKDLIGRLETEAVCGPTWTAQPIFHWSEAWKDYPSRELPRIYAFDFVRFRPQQ